VAIKVLHNQQLTQQKIVELQREVEIMKYVWTQRLRGWGRVTVADHTRTPPIYIYPL
jgi:hypothetical protein